MLSNVRSLLPKVDEVRVICSVRKPDLICITETWLDSSVESSLVHMPGYSLCRNDRKDRRGGGTAVYIRSEIVFADLSNVTADFSKLGVEISMVHLPRHRTLIILMYIPPHIKMTCNNVA